MSPVVASPSTQETKSLSYRSILSIRDYRMLFCSQLVSDLGDGVYRLALLWAMKELTGSAVQMALVLAANLFPTIIVGLISGVLVDRGDKKKYMMASDLFRGLIMAGVTVIWLLGWAQPWMLIAATVLLSCFSAFFTPARTVAVRFLVPKELLTHSQSLSTSLQTIVGLGAPVLAGLLLAIDLTYAFALNAISFFISWVFVYLIRNDQLREQVDSPLSMRNIGKGLKEGFDTITSDRTLRSLIVYVFLLNFVLAPITVMLPLYVDEVSALGATALAVFETMLFVGVFLGSLAAGYAVRMKRWVLVGGGLLLMMLSFAAMSYTKSFTWAAGCMLIVGLGSSLTSIPLQALFMIKVPMNVLGRASSMMRVLTMSSPPLAYMLTGSFLVLVSVRELFLYISLTGAVLVFLMLRNKGILED